MHFISWYRSQTKHYLRWGISIARLSWCTLLVHVMSRLFLFVFACILSLWWYLVKPCGHEFSMHWKATAKASDTIWQTGHYHGTVPENVNKQVLQLGTQELGQHSLHVSILAMLPIPLGVCLLVYQVGQNTIPASPYASRIL